MRRWGIGVIMTGASIYIGGAGLVLAFSHGTWDFRVQVAALFVGAATVLGVFYWMTPAWKKHSPSRLVLGDKGLRMELIKDTPIDLDWNDQSFKVCLWTYPPYKSGKPHFALDIGKYSAVPLEPEPFNALRLALQQQHYAAEETVYRMPLHQGIARRVTYHQTVDRPLDG